MKDHLERIEKLRLDADDCELISKLATDPAKRELFARLAVQLRLMVSDLEASVKARTAAERRDALPGGQGLPEQGVPEE